MSQAETLNPWLFRIMKPRNGLKRTTLVLATLALESSDNFDSIAFEISLQMLKDLIDLQTVIVDREYEAKLKYGPLESRYQSELKKLKLLRDALARKYKSSIRRQPPDVIEGTDQK